MRQAFHLHLLSRASAPNEEEPDIAGHSPGEVEHTRRNSEAMGLQIALPSQIDLRGLAAQRIRPVRPRRVDRPAAVRAELAREAQQQPFLLAVLGPLPGLMDESAPVVVRYMVVDEFFRFCRSC